MKTNIGKEQDQAQEKEISKSTLKQPTAPKNEKEALETIGDPKDGRIVFESQADFHEAVAKVINAVRPSEKSDSNDYGDDREDVQKDLMEYPKQLVTRSKWYQTRSYAVHGKEVIAPNGAITFNYNWFYYMQGKNTITYCIAQIHRQSDWDYLTKHPLFGVVFHEQNSVALSGDMAIVDKQAQSLLALSKLNASQLERKARHYKDNGHDIDMGADTRILMRQLALIDGQKAYQHTQSKMKETIDRSIGEPTAVLAEVQAGI